jgi:hypothetical protein
MSGAEKIQIRQSGGLSGCLTTTGPQADKRNARQIDGALGQGTTEDKLDRQDLGSVRQSEISRYLARCGLGDGSWEPKRMAWRMEIWFGKTRAVCCE